MAVLLGYSSDYMQEKLHLKQHPGTNPSIFESKISDIVEGAIFLDDTYCYPRVGGQPGDKGIISCKGKMTKMQEVLPGEKIIHPVDDVNIFEKGDVVSCEIDRIWRNRNTMMHTAQHVFSAIANDMYGAETVGNQISGSNTRIDLWFPDRDKFDSEDILDQVNSILTRGAEVLIHEWSRDEIKSHEKMRHTKFMDRIPSSVNILRVVEIEGIDLCPCGGTHVSNVSEISPISIDNVRSKGAGKLRVTYW